MSEKLIQHNFTQKLRRGIDDLINTYAFHGNSQGDTFVTNSVEEYKAAEGWLSFMFNPEIDKFDQEAINREIERRKQLNASYIDKLKEEGKYEEEYEYSTTLYVRPNLTFDNPKLPLRPLESYRIIFIDDESKTKNLEEGEEEK